MITIPHSFIAAHYFNATKDGRRFEISTHVDIALQAPQSEAYVIHLFIFPSSDWVHLANSAA